MRCRVRSIPARVVAAELAHPLDDAVQIVPGDFLVRQGNVPVRKAGLGQPPQVQHDLQEFFRVVPAIQRTRYPGRQNVEQLGKFFPD